MTLTKTSMTLTKYSMTFTKTSMTLTKYSIVLTKLQMTLNIRIEYLSIQLRGLRPARPALYATAILTIRWASLYRPKTGSKGRGLLDSIPGQWPMVGGAKTRTIRFQPVPTGSCSVGGRS